MALLLLHIQHEVSNTLSTFIVFRVHIAKVIPQKEGRTRPQLRDRARSGYAKAIASSTMVNPTLDLTGIAAWLGAGVTCFPVRCTRALNRRKTLAFGLTHERRRFESLIA
jgi:hypothetical protein